MSTTTFIPEPLFVYDSTAKTDNGYHGTFDIINQDQYRNGTKVIGNVMPYAGERFCTHEEAKAYAKLFAASPELLNALRKWVGDYEAYHKNEPTDQKVMEAIYKEALAAIEKATA